MSVYKQGAEARIYIQEFLGKKCLVKERFKKSYRHPDLDKSLTNQRMKNEVRALIRCRQCGIPTPCVHYVDQERNAIYMEYLENCATLKDRIDHFIQMKDNSALDSIASKIGGMLAQLHSNDIVHGDLTTSNILARPSGGSADDEQLILIDFGLTTIESSHIAEDKGVDLYVLERALLSTHPNTEDLFAAILDSYRQRYDGSKEVIDKLDEVRLRGRKRTMVG